MALERGSRLGSYEILAFVGKGGMGEVYRARDEKLGREVAIKVLPEGLAGDPERLERFHREARSLAALNHPGIAAIHGLDEAGGQPFLVLELVPGEDLSARIARGAIPVEEALAIARQMAEALEEAHARGLVHRDLKPANVKLTPEGRVKLLDFGLAKALAGDGSEETPDESRSPTLTAQATAAGVILGTAAYMSPEQAKGRTVDARADVWAFACVLYEMLSGRRAFEGDGVSDTLAAVLRSEVELDRIPRDAPARVRPLLNACLQRDPERRVRHMGDVRLALDGAFEAEAAAVDAAAPPPSRGRLVFTALLAAGVGAIAIAPLLVAFAPWEAGPPRQPVAFLEAPPAGTEFVRAPLPSPDGTALAMLVRDDAGGTAIWMRSLDDASPRRLAGTEGAGELFWSPDGQYLAFATPRELRRASRRGGSEQLIAALTLQPRGGGVWTDDGEIVVSAAGRGLVRVAAAGGTPQTLLQRPDVQFLSVAALAGSRILYRLFGDAAGIYAQSLDGGEPTRLVPGGKLTASESQVRFLPPDLLLYRGDGGVLVGQRIDPESLALVGEPGTVAEAIRLDGGFEVGGGVLSLLQGQRANRLAWFDRAGNPAGWAGPPGDYEEVHLSADGRTLLFVRIEPTTGNRDLWVQDLASDAPVRFSFDPATDHLASLSRDGTRVAWETHRGGTLSAYQRPLDGSAPASLVREWGRAGGTLDWSPDGRFVLYWSDDGPTGTNVWALPADGRGDPVAVVEGPFEEESARFSPDGEFLAYTSDETGEREVYVQKLDGLRAAGHKRRVSTGGGMAPLWRRDGAELFFLSGGTLMACPVRREGDALNPGRPEPLFETRVRRSVTDVQYAATPDGQRFVAIVPVTEESGLPATVVVDWRPPAQP